MERILVAIDATHPTSEPLARALCLAERIGVRVAVLAVFPAASAHGPDSAQGLALRREIEAEMEAAKTLGVSAELFVAQGRFDLEVIRAAREMKTTLVVAPAPACAGGRPGQEREAEGLGRIAAAVECRVELVSTKKHAQRTKDGA